MTKQSVDTTQSDVKRLSKTLPLATGPAGPKGEVMINFQEATGMTEVIKHPILHINPIMFGKDYYETRGAYYRTFASWLDLVTTLYIERCVYGTVHDVIALPGSVDLPVLEGFSTVDTSGMYKIAEYVEGGTRGCMDAIDKFVKKSIQAIEEVVGKPLDMGTFSYDLERNKEYPDGTCTVSLGVRRVETSRPALVYELDVSVRKNHVSDDGYFDEIITMLPELAAFRGVILDRINEGVTEDQKLRSTVEQFDLSLPIVNPGYVYLVYSDE